MPGPGPGQKMAGKPESSGSRQVLIVLAVVLALLVLLCAGVISFLLKQGSTGALGGGVPSAPGVYSGVADGGTATACVSGSLLGDAQGRA